VAFNVKWNKKSCPLVGQLLVLYAGTVLAFNPALGLILSNHEMALNKGESQNKGKDNNIDQAKS
jgi:hypothetical protein